MPCHRVLALWRCASKWGLPFGGPAVGVLTAASAGYLYPICARLLWPADLQAVLGPASDGEQAPSFSW